MASSLVGLSALATETPTVPPQASISVSADAAHDQLVFTHNGGDVLNVTRLSLVVAVDGTRLAHQPTIPFFAESGYRSGPTGPFNSAADPQWQAGERASMTLASTNSPAIEPNSTVTVTIRQHGQLLFRIRAKAG